MTEKIFAKTKIDTNNFSENDWTEKQYDQLKNQIIAYKYLLQNMKVPLEVVNNIRNFSPEEWEFSRERQIERIHNIYKEKFENQDFSMKELGMYFKLKNKEIEKNTVLTPETNLKAEVDYTIDCEIECRKNKIQNYLNHINETEENSIMIKKKKKELLLLNIYSIQKKLKKDVIYDYMKDTEKLYGNNISDSVLYRMLLDRKAYKKTMKKEKKFNDKFENQLRNGYDIRKKEKQRDLLNNVLNKHKIFTEELKNKKSILKRRAIQCKQNIENLETKELKEKEKKEKERISYLKQNNMDEYLKLVKDAKDARLEEFIDQTSQFLKEIGGKIQIQKEDIALVNESNLNNNNYNNNNENDKMEIENKQEVNSNKYSSKNYYLSAHSQMEEIKSQPQMLKFGKLKSYQITGLQWLVSLYVNNLNGILADEMGLGKTIQTIALLCYIMESKLNEGPFLIIAPLATISNWMIEFNRWAPDIKVAVYKGAPATRRILSYQIKNDKHKFNVVLTTYEYIMKDKYTLNKITWQYIIVDEGHRMKNYKSKFTQTLGTQFNSVYRLLLTGTPLQNNLSELWALLNFLLPKIFNSCDDFEKWFNQPFSSRLLGERNTELTEEQELLIINRLHTVLRPFLLRREKKDVEKELPSKTEYVIKLGLSSWQKVVYGQIKNQGLLAEDPTTGRMGKKALMNTMMQLRKICNHPYLFLDYNNELFEKVTDWIYKSSGKFEFLDRIIPKLLMFKHKILIFSQMTHLMDILQYYFSYKGIKSLRLDGNTKADDRGHQIELFSKEDSEYKIFILSTRAGGLGLNLQAADTVVIFDSDWNPQMDIQAQDRAHRIGQKHEVKVFRLISKKTIEEGILEKAAFKKNMDEKVISAGLFNSKHTEAERKKKLLDILKIENREEEEEDEILDDTQINEYISRSEEEFKKFQEMDEERYVLENREEKLNEIKTKLNLDNEAIKQVNYRLLQDYEVPDWVKISKEEQYDKIEYENGEKNMRIRKQVNYKDDYDDDFNSDSDEDSKSLKKKRKRNESSSNYDSSEGSNSHRRKFRKDFQSSESLSHNFESQSNIILDDENNNDENFSGSSGINNNNINKVKISLDNNSGSNIIKIEGDDNSNDDMEEDD